MSEGRIVTIDDVYGTVTAGFPTISARGAISSGDRCPDLKQGAAFTLPELAARDAENVALQEAGRAVLRARSRPINVLLGELNKLAKLLDPPKEDTQVVRKIIDRSYFPQEVRRLVDQPKEEDK